MLFERSSILFVLLSLLISPLEAALFPKKSIVKHIGRKEFRDALKEERTFVTAFVAPWCGHCQRTVPELTRAANGLHPLVPVYAVDCDDDTNKSLCAEEGVQGFPTIKLYPEGRKKVPLVFDGARTASSFFYWASRAVPANKIFRGQNAQDINQIVRKHSDKTKIVLLNKTSKTPLLWRSLAQKYGDAIMFGNCRDRQGKVSVDMGFEVTDKKYKIIIYPPGATEAFLYDSIMKFDVLSEFFEGIINGTVNLDQVREEILAKQHSGHLAGSEETKIEETVKETTAFGNLEDETLIDESGYGGFDPHGGVDLEYLLKLTGGVNPHAAGHAGPEANHGSNKESAPLVGDDNGIGGDAQSQHAKDEL